jgi:hypothetical protein
MAIMIEIAGSDRFPTRPGVPPPIKAFLFMSQMAACPLVFCHRMSEWPSPKNVPAPFTNQLAPGFGPSSLAAKSVEPCTCHSASCPGVLQQDAQIRTTHTRIGTGDAAYRYMAAHRNGRVQAIVDGPGDRAA